MQTNNPYTEEFMVHSYEIDPVGRITMTALAGLLQEVATEHADRLNFGFDALRKDNLFWALSKMYYQIERLPKWREKFSITTWHKGYQGATSLRDFLIRNNDGNIITRVTSTWIVVDLDNRKIRRSDQLCGDAHLHTQNAIERHCEKIIIPADLDMKKQGEVIPHFSNIDMNRHVNNVNYYTWALDFLPEDLANIDIKTLEINFIAEAKEGVKMDVMYGNIGNDYFCDIKNSETGTSHCKVKIEVKR
jgi:acyl-ACP thioesterase